MQFGVIVAVVAAGEAWQRHLLVVVAGRQLHSIPYSSHCHTGSHMCSSLELV